MTSPKKPTSSPTIPAAPSTRPPPAQSSITALRPPASVHDAKLEAHAIAGAPLGRTPNSGTHPFAGRKTILIVDSDATTRTKLKRELELFYEVVEARDGMEAVELAPTIPALAMVVSDVAMPRVDGFTLAKIFRANPILKRVPIVFVSSRNTPQDVTQALVLGARQFVVKTTPVAQIAEKIRKIVA